VPSVPSRPSAPSLPAAPLADTPDPPYVAVIFSSTRTDGDAGYAAMSRSMEDLAAQQPGYLGIESARDDRVGITVSYWADDDAARRWKQVAAHLVAQRRGREVWYSDYRVRVARVDRDYGMSSSELDQHVQADGAFGPGPDHAGPAQSRP
jgi:heme-degrading monooxygenase HmoA